MLNFSDGSLSHRWLPPTRAILRLRQRNSGKLLFRSIRFTSILFHGGVLRSGMLYNRHIISVNVQSEKKYGTKDCSEETII